MGTILKHKDTCNLILFYRLIIFITTSLVIDNVRFNTCKCRIVVIDIKNIFVYNTIGVFIVTYIKTQA